ncbi:MAG: hypothetical protein IH840_17930 [Candidatus Heimdallarchaeota archaeon]|nr:hypothetical protein [Candidatus Heimdallarchaeota archaeon]
MKLITLLVAFLLLNPSVQSFAASAGDAGAPPSAGGGGGGGSPQFYDYYVPLVFNASHPHGESQIILWIIQPSILMTSFALNEAGITSAQFQEPTYLEFSPSANLGLTNGSLIRTSSPILITGQRLTEDILSDQSFAYSILSDRMMGFEYRAPFDGYISAISLRANTRVFVQNPGSTAFSGVISLGGTTVTLPVKKGAYINSTEPINAAFLSYSDGVAASMAVPYYLQGDFYVFDGDLSTPRADELDLSYLRVIPTEPTELTFHFDDGSASKVIISDTQDFSLSKNLRGLGSSRGMITVSIHQKHVYGGTTRISVVELMDGNEMRAGELFLTPFGYTSHFSIVNNDTDYLSIIYDPQVFNFVQSVRSNFTVGSFDTISYNGVSDAHLLLGSDSGFGFLSTPAKISHPMAPSVAFLNIPLNAASTNPNRTGIDSTWYRFPNLGVQSIEIIPGPPEEYTGQTIKITVISNGSLPASGFNLDIIINDEEVLSQEYDFLQVNDTLEFEFDQFLSFGIESITVSVNVDTANAVNEINEEDNVLLEIINVEQNVRLRFTGFLIIMTIVIFVLYRIRISYLKRNSMKRVHVDAIIEFEVNDIDR